MSLTPAQQQAISARGNVLVVAGAGTGKTRTLVERCLDCLVNDTPRVSLDQLLVVTFTEAAAAEMRQRIRNGIEEQLRRDPANLRWHEELALFDTAHIGTLHSFCFQLIRPHFYELELDPQMTVMPEEEAQLLADESLTHLLEEHYAGRAPHAAAVQQLLQEHGSTSERAIRALVLRLHHFTQTLPEANRWIRQQLEHFASPEPAQWRQWLLEAFSPWREQWRPLLLTSSQHPLARKCAAVLDEVSKNPTRPELTAALEKVLLLSSSVNANKSSPPNQFQEFAAEAEFLFCLAERGQDIDPLEQDWNWVRGQMTALLHLAGQFTLAFSQSKRELAMADFHDLEQHALRLLWDFQADQPTSVALQWRRKLRLIFVDEYQDINAAQDKIIQALAGEGSRANRFLVGDIKQSIYRFRLANPYIFRAYQNTWRGEAGKSIPLTDNFRSREALLDFINSLFGQLMHEDLGGVAYDQTSSLRFGARGEREALTRSADPGPRVEFHLLLKQTAREKEPEPDDPMTEFLELEDAAQEARLLALRLRKLKAEHHQVWDESNRTFRPVEWRDMAILLRAPARKAESYAKEFSRCEVPLVVQRSGFYESLEITDLLNLLELLDNPLQDLPALGVLHSPLVGLTIAELANIRLVAKGTFWTALVFFADAVKGRALSEARPSTTEQPGEAQTELTRSAAGKVQAFLARFARWRRLARQVSVSRCLETVLAETHYDAWLLTQPRGEQRLANVQRLLGLAHQFDSFQRQGLFRFLCFIAAQKRAQTEPEVKAATTEEAVRLMSIHQSKGLEFPIVALPDLGKRFNLADFRGQIILDEQYGLCSLVKPPHTGKRFPSLAYWLARRRQRRELLGEEMRLLYVAMTRAKDTLVLSAALSKKKFATLAGRSEPIPSTELLHANSYADWLGPWFAQHCPSAFSNVAAGLQTKNQPEEEGEDDHELAPSPVIRHASPSIGHNELLRWFIHDENSLAASPADLPGQSRPSVLELSRDEVNQLRQRLSWEYPFTAATRLPAKASVTAISRRTRARIGAEEATAFIPGLETRRGRTAADAVERGTVHHAFLQYVALEQTTGLEQLKREAQRLQSAHILSPEEVGLLDFDALTKFWLSDLGQKIRAQASFVHRELPFTARFTPRQLAELTGESAEARLDDEIVIIQGVADLAVITPQDLWLLDFKTDVLTPKQLEQRVKLYEPQMKLYARSLAQIYQRPIAGCWLYFLELHQAVPIAPQSALPILQPHQSRPE